MENQGKRKDQMEYSRKVVFWSLVGMVVMVVILTCTDMCNNAPTADTTQIDLTYPDEDVMWIGNNGDTIWE